MKISHTLLLRFCLCLSGYFCSAQLYTDAGANRTICRGDSVLLGGADTATNAIAPFTYQWQPATGLSATNVAHPVARPAVTTTYYLTSSDANGVVSVDSVTVVVTYSDVYITAGDTLVCQGRQVQLRAIIATTTCGSTAPCFGSTPSPVLGNDTISQPGTSLQGPSLFGNFRKSSRSQMLYTAAELQTVLGGPMVIKVLTFKNSLFNSNAFLQNFTVKMGCSYSDSLTTWNDNLFTVYSAATYQPQAGWNNSIVLQTPYYWDGYSDLVIDICNYNTATFGNQNNKAECTQTAFASYLYSTGATNQCGGGTIPTTYYLRPNVKFNYCVPDSVPTPIFGSNYQWTSSSGLVLFNANSFTPAAQADSAGYCYFTVQENGCVFRDSVFVAVHSTGNTTFALSNNFCPESGTGSAIAIPTGYIDTVSYWLSVLNSADTIFSGLAVNGDSIYFAGLAVGDYTLHVPDPVCGDLVNNFSLTGYPSLYSVTTSNVQEADCNGVANGGFCLDVSGGTLPYVYYWDSLITLSNCNYSLSAGTHTIRVVDATGCTVAINNIEVETANDPISGLVAYNYLAAGCGATANGGFCINVSGGTPPYTYVWDTVETQSACYYNLSGGTHYVQVTDSNGCNSAVTPFNVLMETNDAPVLTVLDFVHCYGEATGNACVTLSTGTSPYIYVWDSLYTGGICNDTLSAGTHFVIVRDAFGCEGRSNTITIHQPGGPLTVNSSINNSTLYLDIDSGTIPYTIRWGDSTEYMTVATAQHTYNNDGVYEVVVSDMNGCDYTMTVTILGAGIAAIGNGLYIYPNPAGNSLIIRSDGQSIRNIKILDELGRVVLSPEAIAGHVVDISGLAAGVYVAAVQTTSGELTHLFVKQ